MTEEEYLLMEALTLARAVRVLLGTVTDVPELEEARRQASLAEIRLAELVETEPE